MDGFSSPVTVEDTDDANKLALCAQMEMLQRHLETLKMTNEGLLGLLERERMGAEEVQRKLTPGKREMALACERPAKGRARDECDDSDDDEGGAGDPVIRGIRAMDVGSASSAAPCLDEARRKADSSRGSLGNGRLVSGS